MTYIYDAKGVIGMAYRNDDMASGEFEYYLFEKNLQGDIVAVYTASGTKLVSYAYDAWGNITTNYSNGGGSTAVRYNSFRYRGYFYDEETKLYYLNARYYDPATGRLLNPDIYVNANGDLTGFNMYAYCSGNPVAYADYTGEDAVYVVTDALPVVGHALVFIETTNGWYKIQFASMDSWNPKDAVVNISKLMTKDEVLSYIKTNSTYKTVYIEGDFTRSYNKAKLYYDNPVTNGYNQKYNLLTNNCLHFAKDILLSGEFEDDSIRKFILSNNDIVPNRFYRNLYMKVNKKNIWIEHAKLIGHILKGRNGFRGAGGAGICIAK